MNKRKWLETYMREKNQMIVDICGNELYCEDDFNFPYLITLERVDDCIENLKLSSLDEYNDWNDFIYDRFCPQCAIFNGNCGECFFAKNHNECNSEEDSHWYIMKNKINDAIQRSMIYQKSIENFIKWNKVI